MNRLYDSTSYRNKVFEVITKIPEISIGTDVIVGFPGESEQAFLKMKNLIEDIPFAYLHIFPYSSRPGSLASRFSDHIEVSFKKRRYDVLNHINNRKKISFMESQSNRILEIVIEDVDRISGMIGTSSNYLKVAVCSDSHEKKSLISVRVTGRDGDILRGEVVERL
jgi:threonylcarbamoyladenosine tRNA methylthiotransferase MtaB